MEDSDDDDLEKKLDRQQNLAKEETERKLSIPKFAK